MLEFMQTNVEACNWIMPLIVFIAVFLFKFPIKYLNKKISNEKVISFNIGNKKYQYEVRQLLNIFILLLPIAFGILIQWLYSNFVLNTTIDVVNGLTIGAKSIAFYGIIEKFLGKKINNPYNDDKGDIIIEAIEDIIIDEKVDFEDIETAENALDKLSKLE